MNVNKHSIAVNVPDEFLYTMSTNPAHRRKIEHTITHQPTENDWAEYRKAKEAWDYLQESPYFDPGCNCEYPSVSAPEPRTEYIYAETHDEWLTRCRQESEPFQKIDWPNKVVTEVVSKYLAQD